MKPHFLVVDGYPQQSREEFEKIGMTLAYKLYTKMVQTYIKDATCEPYLPSDPGVQAPPSLDHYAAIFWTGCNLTVYKTDDERVQKQLALAKRAYDIGVPSFGSCWGLQIAVYAAGGEVKAHPLGREMGVARKVHLTDAGREHPMYRGKGEVFDGWISHDDEVTSLPAGATLLASNDYTRVQACHVRHRKGEFWAVQYHPEYDAREMAKLIEARSERLIKGNFFADTGEVKDYAGKLERLSRNVEQKNLRWQLGIDNDVLNQDYRCLEFKNFLDVVVRPRLSSS